MSNKCIVLFLTDDTAPTYDGKPLMLQDVLFCPVLNWCMRAWMEKGIERFFVVCDSEHHDDVLAVCPPDAIVAVGTEDTYESDIAEFAAHCWVEEIREAVFPLGSMMLTFRTVEDLSRLQQSAKEHIAAYHQRTMVNILDPNNTYIDPRVTIAPGTTILPGTILRGNTVIGENCTIGPGTMIRDCVIGDEVEVNASQVTESYIGKGTHVGPYAHIRPKCHVGERCKIGAFVEIKNAVFGEDTKLSHLTYVGDSDVGSRVNFGCGTITSNYDGFKKSRTIIEDDVFVGCNTNFVPPVRVGRGAYIAAATTVTKDVEADALAIGRARQEVKSGWAKRNREMRKKK